jgi:WD40 repeat protein
MGERTSAASDRRRGRPVKDRAQTPEARALATWLRERVTGGMTNRQLADQVSVYGHAKWAEFRNGADVIPQHVLELLLIKVVPEPRLRERLLAEGRELVGHAEQAAVGKLAANTAGLSEQELLHRLHQAQQAQIEAQHQMLHTGKLVGLLLSVLHSSRQQNQTLQAEAAHQRQQAARLRLELAQKRLRDARDARDEAEDLHLEGYAQAEQYRRLLGEHRVALELPATLAAPELRQLTEQECDRLLGETAGVLLQIWQTLHDIRECLGLPAAPDHRGPAIVHGQVVDNPESQARPLPQGGCDGEQDEQQEQGPQNTKREPDASGHPPARPEGSVTSESAPPSALPDAASAGETAVHQSAAAEERQDEQPSHRLRTGVWTSLPRRRAMISLAATAATALLSAGDSKARRAQSPPARGTGDDPFEIGPGSDLDTVTAVAVGTMNGRTIAVSGGDTDILRVWDLATGRPVGKPRFGGVGTAGSGVAVGTLDGKTIAVSSGKYHAQVWDLATGQRLSELRSPHPTSVHTVAVGNLDGRTIAVSSGPDDIRMWDPATGELVREPLTYDGGWASILAVGTLRGRTIAVVHRPDSTLRVWDLATGRLVGKPIQMEEGLDMAVAVGTMNAIAVSGDFDTLRVWDLVTGMPLGKFRVDKGRTIPSVNGVAVGTLRGRTIAVVSRERPDNTPPPHVTVGVPDSTVRVWDLTTHKPVGKPLQLRDSTWATMAVATMNGKTIVVVGDANTVRVRPLGPA